MGQCRFPKLAPAWQRVGHRDIFDLATVQLNDFFWGRSKAFNLPYHFRGAVLQEKVQEAQQTYSCGSHRHRTESTLLTFLLPCHRVVGRDGKLRGFASGIEVKRGLLTMKAG